MCSVVRRACACSFQQCACVYELPKLCRSQSKMQLWLVASSHALGHWAVDVQALSCCSTMLAWHVCACGGVARSKARALLCAASALLPSASISPTFYCPSALREGRALQLSSWFLPDFYL
jgi:hypothetical protein